MLLVDGATGVYTAGGGGGYIGMGDGCAAQAVLTTGTIQVDVRNGPATLTATMFGGQYRQVRTCSV